MAEEIKPNPENKQNLFHKIKVYIKSLKERIKNTLRTSSNIKGENAGQNPKTKIPFIYVFVGISIGFIFGAFISGIILYKKIKDVQEEYQRTQIRLKMLSARVNSVQNKTNQNTSSINQASKLNPAQIINNLPSSDAFASFYVKKLDEEKQITIKEPKPEVKPLPSLKQLVGQTPKNMSQPTLISQGPPPLPKVSMIICSGSCYAISSDGQVYTNGYSEGEYSLVVNQNQIYWIKK